VTLRLLPFRRFSIEFFPELPAFPVKPLEFSSVGLEFVSALCQLSVKGLNFAFTRPEASFDLLDLF
jgi:hypothetical protein